MKYFSLLVMFLSACQIDQHIKAPSIAIEFNDKIPLNHTVAYKSTLRKMALKYMIIALKIQKLLR